MVLNEIQFDVDLDVGLNAIRQAISTNNDFLPRSSEPEVGDWLLHTAKLIQAKSILEIGTFKGYTTCKLIASGAKVTTCDIQDNRHQLVVDMADKLNLYRFINLPSHETLMLLKEEKRRFDLIFIDGDHNEDYVQRELELITHGNFGSPLLVLHDPLSDNCPGVLKAIKTHCDAYHKDFVVLNTSRGCGLAII